MKRIIVCSILLFTQTLFAGECGLFKIVKQDVTYQKKGKKKYRKARINKKVCVGDKVKTGLDSRAKIQMAGADEINLSPETEILISKIEGKGDNKKVLLDVLYGKIRSMVKDKYKDNKQSYFRVRTKTAVAGVRGTEFLTSFNLKTKLSQVVTFSGEVAVGDNIAGNYNPTVVVKAGFLTKNVKGMTPHPPQKVSPEALAQFNKETTLEGSSNSNRGVSSEKKANKEKKPKKHKKQKSPKKVNESNNSQQGQDRQPDSVGVIDLETEISQIEDSFVDPAQSINSVEIDELPVPQNIIDGSNVKAPQIDTSDLIDNVIQNPKTNLQINIGVQ